MSHIDGHWEDSTVGAALTRNSFGIIHIHNDQNFKLLFVNNRATGADTVYEENMAYNEGKADGDKIAPNAVGFHLLLIPVEKDGEDSNDSFFGLAYDVVPLSRHKKVDQLSQREYHKAVEELNIEQMDKMHELIRANGKEKEISILKQTSTYTKTESYQRIYKGTKNLEGRIARVKQIVINYSDANIPFASTDLTNLPFLPFDIDRKRKTGVQS